MRREWKQWKEAILHLFFPHCCAGCGSDRLPRHQPVCIRCMAALPETGFAAIAGNPIEKKFWGRLPLESAYAHFYFSRESAIQRLMHALKYKGHREWGLFAGRLMGEALLASPRIQPDALIPLPLYASRQKARGYNQSELLCRGIAAETGWPIYNDVVIRSRHTESQTHKTRIERWQNMAGNFQLINHLPVAGKHLLLVDDVITTGATLEACGSVLLQATEVKLSVATLCYAN